MFLNIDPTSIIDRAYEQSWIVGLLITIIVVIAIALRFMFFEWKKQVDRQEKLQLQTNTVIINNTTTNEKLAKAIDSMEDKLEKLEDQVGELKIEVRSMRK